MSEIKLLEFYENDIEPIESEQLDDWDAFRIEEQRLDTLREEKEKIGVKTKPEPQGQMEMIISDDGTSFDRFDVNETEDTSDKQSDKSDIDSLNSMVAFHKRLDYKEKSARNQRFSNIKKKNWDKDDSENRQNARSRAEKYMAKACLGSIEESLPPCEHLVTKRCRMNVITGTGSVMNHLDDYMESTYFLKNIKSARETGEDTQCGEMFKKPSK